MVEYLLGGARGEPVGALLEQHEGALHAPALLDVEVAQAVRRLVAAGVMTSGHGTAAIEILGELPVTRHAIPSLLPRMWALRHDLTAYDACYAALAEGLGCTLMTSDQRLAKTVRARCAVDVVTV